MDNTEARAIINCLQKKERHDAWIYFGFELLQDPPNSQNSDPSDFNLFPKLKSHLPGLQFGTIRVVEQCLGVGARMQPSSLRGLQCMNIALPSVLILTLSQTSPSFYVSAVQAFWKHSGKRRNCSWRAISPFPTVFSTHSENFLSFSSNLKLSSGKSFSLEGSKICCLGKG